jgi:pimeloyl-ACP methyl ester carboxylesterase
VLSTRRALAQDVSLAPFQFHAADEALSDLKLRLGKVRWPDRETAPDWGQGPPLARMQALIEAWRTHYDWRKAEKALHSWPQFKATIDGLGIHFIHVRSKHPRAMPIILTHGWPSSILLFRDVVAPLTDPTAFGGTPDDAFDVVIPSLPGYGFSDKPKAPGWNAQRTARAWNVLMQRLGYEHYVAQGGDWGAYVTTALAQQRPPGLAAIHLNFAQTIPDNIPAELKPDQKRAVEAMKAYKEKAFGYGILQGTKPQLAGYLLSDSPMAQAAWIYDLFNEGTGVTGNPESVIARDKMLDEITLYWLTDSGASSARFYAEQAAIMGQHNNAGRVDIPVAVSAFPHDLPAARSWAKDVYPHLFYWNEPTRGGHFVQLEAPDLFVDELRRAFRTFDTEIGRRPTRT